MKNKVVLITAMLKNGGGSIINTSSVAGSIGLPGASVYIASKHAVEGLTKAAALEVAKQGIRINAVAPGGVVTDMLDRFTGGIGSDVAQYLTSLHPIGRLGQAQEIAQPVLWLASEASSFVTGQIVKVDGGWTVQ
ncbi:MAG: SDR family oxidoreductase [Terrimicrobiaceae bacterium]|nr:SDR family oxidoreductase [Terrimicrobiaceae bacterium]